MSHLIAVVSYGSQRVRSASGKVSTYKIGYTTAGGAVLQALCGDRTKDITPKRARSH